MVLLDFWSFSIILVLKENQIFWEWDLLLSSRMKCGEVSGKVQEHSDTSLTYHLHKSLELTHPCKIQVCGKT